jgi:CRISPR system Cascade subunit CasE
MSLHLVRLQPNPVRLLAYAAAEGVLPRNGGDLGYAIHLALRRSLGLAAPQPFQWFEEKGHLLGYVRDLAMLMDSCGLPALDSSTEAARSALSLATLDHRSMPAVWRPGARYGFEVRVRPVRRIGKDKRGDGPGEHDAFGLAVRGRPRNTWPAAASVYADWTTERLMRGGAIPVNGLQLLSFKRTEIVRRRHDDARSITRLDGPDVTFSGTLEIREADAFGALLARGLGRHVAFGFGMLLLQPVQDRSLCS